MKHFVGQMLFLSRNQPFNNLL